MTRLKKEGWGYDYATGRRVNMRKPEEAVRQDYERTLHRDYGYDTSQMDIEVNIQRGVRTADRADVIVYRTANPLERDQFSDIIGIVETKRPNRADGLQQLMSYMTASSAQWGVWTNGDDIEHVYRDPTTGELKTGYIFDIPRSGESFQDIGRITKSDLVPAHAHSLKPIFNRILKTLYSNTSISRREKLGSEMIRLIFTKIWDERFNLESLPQFRVGLNEDPEYVKRRVILLFEQVKQELVEDGVFDEGETITLDARAVAWVVGQLERYSLTKTDKDVVGDAFEVFAESKLVGEKGEFFTPREVVRTAVELVDPRPGHRICDPACGSGGFLIYALEHVWRRMDDDPRYRNSPMIEREKHDVARRCFFGIDKEIDLVKIAKAYMAITGDGRGGIVQGNTLHAPADFGGRAGDLFTLDGEFRQFDIVFTNPPFGKNIKVMKSEAAQFALGHRWRKVGEEQFEQTDDPKDTEPQILFVERCLQMLRDGGILAIVLPETFFHATSYRYILKFMLEGNSVMAVVDLPHNTFRPHNNAKTCLLVLQKGVQQQEDILMAVAEQMGHDHEGRPMFRFDEALQRPSDKIWDDLAIVQEELTDPYNESNEYTFMVNVSNIKNSIYIPRYYWPRSGREIEQAEEISPLSLNRLLDEGIIDEFHGHGSPESEYKGKGPVPYIRVSDVVNWELYRNPTAGVPFHVYQRIKGRNGVTLKPRDVVFVRRGSYRIGTVAMASPFDTEVLLMRELVILRIVKPDNEYGIDPYYLLYLLSHKYTQAQIEQKVFMDTTLPNIADRWKELELPVSVDSDVRSSVSDRVKAVVEAKWKAVMDLSALRSELGDITT